MKMIYFLHYWKKKRYNKFREHGIKVFFVIQEVEKALLHCGAKECAVFGINTVNALVVGNVDEQKLKQSHRLQL